MERGGKSKKRDLVCDRTKLGPQDSNCGKNESNGKPAIERTDITSNDVCDRGLGEQHLECACKYRC